MNQGITVVLDSKNEKTGLVSATYCTLDTCPSYCPFRFAGCYACDGNVGVLVSKLNLQGKGLDVLQLSQEEARQIESLPDKRPLRLHVSGDCRTDDAVRVISAACDKRVNPTWGYTHAWALVNRASWGKVSILASCETAREIHKASGKGYAVATVNGEAIETELKALGFRLLTCPAQTRKGVTCTTCKLCWKDGLLRSNRIVINFKAHGGNERKLSGQVAMIRKGEKA